MCGIIGYVGKRNSVPILVEGLKRLEYRGYDSSGISLNINGNLDIYKKAGKIVEMERILPRNLESTIGIGHTRWATHGSANDFNAHPHLDGSGDLALVHNGIIENSDYLRKRLEEEGHKFESDTDTEVLAHLIGKFYKDNLKAAVRKALELVQGTYGVVVMHKDQPNRLIGARNGSPLLVGVGNNEYFIASDVPAIIAHTKQVIFLEDKEIVEITDESFTTTDMKEHYIEKDIQKVDIELSQIEKGGYEHFMLKEIFEQPESINRAFSGRLLADIGSTKLGGLNLTRQELFSVERVRIIACGTSFHAGLVGAEIIERLARIPTSVEIASEVRYKNPIIEKNTIFFCVSQSGETMDTLFAMREIQRKGGKVLGICNVVGSTIPRESDGGIYVHSGPEIAVASTKAFTSQLMAFYLFAIQIGRMRDLSQDFGKHLVGEIEVLPQRANVILSQNEIIQEIAQRYARYDNFLILGRGLNYPVALEGALKLTEVSYIHAQGLPAAEIKHGPIALIDDNTPVIIIIPKDEFYDKSLSTIEEVKARNGKVIAISNFVEEKLARLCDDIIHIPETHRFFTPFTSVIALQLLSYHIARILDREIDQPRNLAKSVTVE